MRCAAISALVLSLTACGQVSAVMPFSIGGFTRTAREPELHKAPVSEKVTSSYPRLVQRPAARVRQYLFAATEGMPAPETARYRNSRTIEVAPGVDRFCAEINTSDGSGGYVGYQPFSADFDAAGEVTEANTVRTVNQVGAEAVLLSCATASSP